MKIDAYLSIALFREGGGEKYFEYLYPETLARGIIVESQLGENPNGKKRRAPKFAPYHRSLLDMAGPRKRAAASLFVFRLLDFPSDAGTGHPKRSDRPHCLASFSWPIFPTLFRADESDEFVRHNVTADRRTYGREGKRETRRGGKISCLDVAVVLSNHPDLAESGSISPGKV